MSWRALGVSVLLLGSGAAQAASLGMEVGADDGGGSDVFVSGVLSREDGAYVMLGAGATQSDTRDATNWMVEAGGAAGQELFGSIAYAYSGSSADLETRTLSLTIGYQTESWAFRLTPRVQEHRLYIDSVMAQRSHAEVESTGVRIAVDYYAEDWHVGVAHRVNDYERDVSALAARPVFRMVFAPTTLSMAVGLEDTASELRADYRRGDNLWGVELARITSAVDGSELRSRTLRWSHDVGADWTATLRVGVSRIDDGSDDVRFAAVAVDYFWD